MHLNFYSIHVGLRVKEKKVKASNAQKTFVSNHFRLVGLITPHCSK